MAATAVVVEVAVIKRIAWSCAWLAVCGPAWALDADIQFHIQARKTQAAPLCASLLARTDTLPASDLYKKALCQLYGLQTPTNSDDAIQQLRTLAVDGMAEAQLALADTLQQGDAAQQQEAVQWYRRAAAAGDVRAASRQARLAGRLQAAADAANAVSTPSTPDSSDPYADMLNNAATQQPGYHCHMYGLGKKVCHGGMD